MRVFSRSILVIGFVALLAANARGATVERMSLNQLAARSTQVIEGNVLGTRTAWNDEHTLIFTHVTFDVTRVYAGDVRPGRTEFQLIGGEADGIRLSVPGTVMLEPGEHVVLFIDDSRSYQCPIVGLGQGKLVVSRDPASGEEWVGNRFIGHFTRDFLRDQIVQAREGTSP